MIFPVTTLANLSLAGLLCWLCLSAAAIYGFGPSYWTLPAQVLADSAGAAAFGFLNIFGGLGSFVGPSVVGTILSSQFSFRIAVLFLSGCFLLAGVCAFAVRSRGRGLSPSLAGHAPPMEQASPGDLLLR